MKPTATLINIARGGIVDDAALAVALREQRIAAAGLDVFEGEPSVHPDLLTVPNVVLTPHCQRHGAQPRRAMANLAADNLIAFLGGRGAHPNQPARARPACLRCLSEPVASSAEISAGSYQKHSKSALTTDTLVCWRCWPWCWFC